MNPRDKIKLLCEVEELIVELGGIDGQQFNQIGVTMSELENPTKETIIKLREYLNKLKEQKENQNNYER